MRSILLEIQKQVYFLKEPNLSQLSLGGNLSIPIIIVNGSDLPHLTLNFKYVFMNGYTPLLFISLV